MQQQQQTSKEQELIYAVSNGLNAAFTQFTL